MKHFLDKDFLLATETSKLLYHDYAKKMPVIDYHCHLPPQEIAENINFNNLTHAWLYGDHYKWRAMRTNGVNEKFITGNGSDREKFEQWAATVPYTLRNPLYHWTHLELQRYFNIDTILNRHSAKKVYDEANALLASKEFSTRGLLKKMNVQIVCTTDDPVDDLRFHKQVSDEGFSVKIFPAFRPDKAMAVANVNAFNAYVNKLATVADTEISDIRTYLDALKKRHDFFAAMGCRVSDHGLEKVQADEFTMMDIKTIFLELRAGRQISEEDQRKFQSAMLLFFAEWDWEKGWVQQYHLGALRNNNKRLLAQLGPDTGWDSIGDFPQAEALARFLTRLDENNKLAKTIIYNLNPADNEVMATMIGNYNDGSVAGKIQWGSGWWFLDQKDGMTKQINALSNMSLLSRFVGMITDSRSFLSYPRHEYFRRILCNIFGEEIESGELPNDMAWTGKIIQDICFNNAKEYFHFL
ncbi:glucuronate isomerase [Parafilimonas sp.]|uniref:glucuronate isomerase n=1 Tax=Parafilimonas sp. TaxID=1969739 RepID=UPI0039E3F7F6